MNLFMSNRNKKWTENAQLNFHKNKEKRYKK